jgi:DNA-binding GntR family transcriptional regulator
MRLAEQLGVSRGPVRSALHVLEGEGLVTTKRNGRMAVVGFDNEDLRDLFATRYHLEAWAIRLGIDRQSKLDGVEQAFAALLAEGNSTPRLVSLDVAFHRALVEFSRSRFLLRAWLALAPVIQTAIAIGNRHLVEQDPQSNFSRIVDSHQALMDALRARDADAAETMLERQFDFSRSMVTAGT